MNSGGQMSMVEAFVKDYSKLIAVTNDLHDMRDYLNHVRLCFVALTLSGYVGILVYLFVLCHRKRRRRQRSDRQRRQRSPSELYDLNRDWELHNVHSGDSYPYKATLQRPQSRMRFADPLVMSAATESALAENGPVRPPFANGGIIEKTLTLDQVDGGNGQRKLANGSIENV